ncbi:MAG: hypothetical protein COC01_06790 [Bacteroidetes bacterium]|nr:MAG: hypothetical protein COC01_06790 [Bacteroidota bacterium]
MTGLWIYLSLGGLVHALHKDLRYHIYRSFSDIKFEYQAKKNLLYVAWQYIGGLFIGLPLKILFWPFFLWDCIQYELQLKKHIELNAEKRKLGLFFDSLSGSGMLICNNCKWQKSIIAFIHGLTSGPNRWCCEGVQCQSCGDIGRVESGEKNDKCACGSNFSKKEVLFCPDCKSNNLKYIMKYIT